MRKLKNLMIADTHIKELDYYNSELYCQLLDIDNKNWRMPTLDEAKMICKNLKDVVDYRWIWAVNEDSTDSAYAVHSNFHHTNIFKDAKIVYIIPVRSL